MWVLYNLAHKYTKIRSLDGDAWIRVLGFFQFKEEALAHAKKLCKVENMEIRIAPQNEFRVLLRTDYDANNVNKEREIEKYHFLMDRHLNNRKKAFEETLKNAEAKVVGSIAENQYEIASFETKKEFLEGNMKDISNTLRMQNFCAVAVIPDYEFFDDQEKSIDEWDSRRLQYFNTFRNAKIHECNFKFDADSLMRDFVEKNPPPCNLNIYGQKMIPGSSYFEKNGNDKVENDSNFVCWSNIFKKEMDARLWSKLGVNEDELNVKYERWNQENQCPIEFTGAEPMVGFIDVGNTEEEIRKKIEENNDFLNFDIGCVAMYEWIKVKNAWTGKVKKTYREKLVAELHEKRETLQKQADIFKNNENFKTIEIK